jgi:pimeloyl-ACP methyl ester carboxylesterase
MKSWTGSVFVVALFACARLLSAQPPAAVVATPAPLNLAWRTLGGEQLWSDVLVYGAWRIQRNELTGHFRLLDANDVRRAWGSREQCQTEFDRLRRANVIPPLAGRAVITLHGFGRSRDHMAAIGRQLCESGQFTSINVSYSSTRGAIDDHAESLAQVIQGLEGIHEIHFVCHSLGNLVVRRYLGEASASEPRWPLDSRLKRMVMLGPPNNGARVATLIAELLHDNELARFLAGPSAWQMARQWDEASKHLATPGFEFGILAGGYGDNRGLNLLLEGDDDLVVAVNETRLPGAADFRIVSCRHGRLMSDPLVQQYASHFLEHGCFTTLEQKQPIERAAENLPPRAQP